LEPTAISTLVGELLLAIQLLTGYSVPALKPEIKLVPHQVIEQQACDGHCQVLGWFPPGSTIYLDDRLNPIGHVGHKAILLHELVHYLQQENGAHEAGTDCRNWQDREQEAVDIQYKWLVEQHAPLSAMPRNGRAPWRLACPD